MLTLTFPSNLKILLDKKLWSDRLLIFGCVPGSC